MTEIIHIAPKEAFALSQQGVLLVDVREADEVAQKRYEVTNYVNLPLSKFTDMYEELPTGQQLIIACLSGGRSQKAIAFLQTKGYEELLNLDGGIKAWEAEGLPVV
jgi:rhodanese domain protein